MSSVEIAPSALKRDDVTASDIQHALRQPMRVVAQDERRVLVIGADAKTRLLEIVVRDPETDHAVVIHAMPLRRGFYRYLVE